MADGITRLREAFSQAGRPLLVPYMMGGYPTLAGSHAVAAALAPYADILEIGIAFSDPLADGPTIQAAGQIAIDAGVLPEDVFAVAEGVRGGPPVVLMTSVNLVLAAGPERFFGRCAETGVAGLIISDLPCDEGAEVRAAAARHGVSIVPLVAPTTSDARLREVADVTDSFVYCVSVAGVTGGAVNVDADLAAFVARVRRHIPAPAVVGFGIQTPAHAHAIGRIADGVVVGSQLVRCISGAPELDDGIAAAAELARQMSVALGRTPA